MANRKSALEEVLEAARGFKQSVGRGVSDFAKGAKVVLQPKVNNAVSSVSNYLNPRSPNNYWSNTISRGPAGHDFSNFPKLQFAERVSSKVQNPIARPLASLGLGAVESILNTPSMLLRGSSTINNQLAQGLQGKGDMRKAVSGAGELGEGLLNVYSFGTGGAILNQLRKQSLRALAKQGAKEGLKYGAGYGLSTGVRRNENAPNVLSQITRSLPDVAIGGGAGAVLGGALPVVSRGIEKYVTSPLARKIIDKWGMEGYDFLANRDLIKRVTLGIASPEEMAQFKILNDSGLAADAARAKGGISVSSRTPKYKSVNEMFRGKIWDKLRELFPTSFDKAGKPKSSFYDEVSGPLAQIPSPDQAIDAEALSRDFSPSGSSMPAGIMDAPNQSISDPGNTQIVPPTRQLTPPVSNMAYSNTITNGGVTISLDKVMPSTGYAFSPFKEAETIVPKDQFTEQNVVEFISRNQELLTRPDNFIGMWYNEADGNVYLDVSTVKQKFDEAILEARNSKQIAVFDLSKFEEIKVPYEENITRPQENISTGNIQTGTSLDPGIPGEEATASLSPGAEDLSLNIESLNQSRNIIDTPSFPQEIAPEARERIEILSGMVEEARNEILQIERILKNYDLVRRASDGPIATKRELGAIKRDLEKSIRLIEKQISEAGKQTVERIPSNEELAMNMLRQQQTPETMPQADEDLAMRMLEQQRQAMAPSPEKIQPVTSTLPEGFTPEADMAQAPMGAVPPITPDTPRSQVTEDMVAAHTVNSKEIAKDFKELIRQFVGEKNAGKTIATEIAEPFTKIPRKLQQEVIDHMEGSKLSNNPEVQKWAEMYRQANDQMFAQAQAAGIDMNYREGHVAHMWDMPVDELKAKYANAKSKYGFAEKREIPTYAEGRMMGLKPRFEHPALIIESEARALQRAIAARKLYQESVNRGYIVPAKVGRKLPGFDPIIARGFEGMPGDLYAPTEIADMIHKAFSPEKLDYVGQALRKGARLSAFVQDLGMSGGVPFTNINAFWSGQAIREITAGVGGLWNSPAYSAKRIVSPLVNTLRTLTPGGATNYFKKHAASIKELQLEGWNGKPQRTAKDLIDMGVMEKYFGKNRNELWGKAISNPTFNKYMPMMEISIYEDIKKGLLKAGVSPGEATKRAASALFQWQGKTHAGDDLLKNKSTQDALTIALFAPKYRESMIRSWWAALKGASPVHASREKGVTLNNPFSAENKTSTNFLIGTVITIVAMDRINRALNDGRPMFDNPPGTEDKLLIPVNDTLTVGIPLLPGVGTIPRAIYRSGRRLLEGDLPGVAKEAKSFTSLLLSPLVEAGANEDYFGNQIYNDNDSPGEKYKKIGTHLALQYNHPWIESAFNQYTGKYSTAQNLSQAAELPIRFYTNKSLNARYYFDNLRSQRETLNPEEQKYWDMLYKNPAMDAEDGLPVYDKRGAMANALIRLKHPALVQAEMEAAFKTSQETGQPINPFYLLDPQQQEVELMLKTFYPGDETKKQIQNENLTWLKPYWEAKAQWSEKMVELGIFKDLATQPLGDAKIGGASTLTGADIDLTPSPELQAKLDYYQTLPQGTGARSNFLRANPDVKAFFDASAQKTNDQRMELGLPPLPGFGSGGGGGGGFGGSSGSTKIKMPKAPSTKSSLKLGPTKENFRPLKAGKSGSSLKLPPLPKIGGGKKYSPGKISLKIKYKMPDRLSGVGH